MDKVQFLARLSPFQSKERATKGPLSGMAALSCLWFAVVDGRKCQRRAARVSQVKSLPHHVHGPADAVQPMVVVFGKMDKVELRVGCFIAASARILRGRG